MNGFISFLLRGSSGRSDGLRVLFIPGGICDKGDLTAELHQGFHDTSCQRLTACRHGFGTNLPLLEIRAPRFAAALEFDPVETYRFLLRGQVETHDAERAFGRKLYAHHLPVAAR